MNIHAGRQPELHAKLLHLLANQLSAGSDSLRIPGLCQSRSNRNGGAILMENLLFGHFLQLSGQVHGLFQN